MAALLRSAPALIVAAFANRTPIANRADLFTFTLSDGITVFNFTSWGSDLPISGTTYTSSRPWLTRTKRNITNTMEVPKCTLELLATNDAFNAGAQLKTQLHNGLFDGASFVLSRVLMPTPGDVTTLGVIPNLFSGQVSDISIGAVKTEITIKGRSNRLDQYFPRNRYQVGCNHAFCDPGCTLSRVTFTASFTVGSSPAPTTIFVPWGTPPATPSLYIGGTLKMTGGAASGQQRNIANADSTGLTLAYPMYQTPATGDAFTAFQGCDKTFNSGSGRSCTDHANTQNYDGFEFVPPPNMAY